MTEEVYRKRPYVCGCWGDPSTQFIGFEELVSVLNSASDPGIEERVYVVCLPRPVEASQETPLPSNAIVLEQIPIYTLRPR